MPMICFLSCMIMWGNVQYSDTCESQVEAIYQTDKYRYVKLLQFNRPKEPSTINIKIWQRVLKTDCYRR